MKKKLNFNSNYFMVFVDTNIFYNILFETEYVDISQQLLETIPSPITSYTVVNELIFIVARKAIERKLGIRSYYESKKVIVEKGYELVGDYIDKAISILKDANVRIIDDYHNLRLHKHYLKLTCLLLLVNPMVL